MVAGFFVVFLRAGDLRAGDFLVAGFLAATFLLVVFFAAVFFFVAGFLAATFLFAAVFFFAAGFFAAGFLLVVFLVAGLFLVAAATRTGDRAPIDLGATRLAPGDILELRGDTIRKRRVVILQVDQNFLKDFRKRFL